MGIVVVNSTIAGRRSMCTDGQISPIHYWGYHPHRGDTLLCAGQNRVEIVLRHRVFGGTDPRVLFRTVWELMRGARGLYIVSQPDLLAAVPMIKRLFPKRPIATWTWTANEARANAHLLRVCDHVFSLTELGFDELRALGLDGRCSLGLWGCDPVFYQMDEAAQAVEHDLLFFGLISRDVELVRNLVATREFTIATGKRSIPTLGAGLTLREVGGDSKVELLRAIHASHLSLIPLLAGDPEPTGFTNLIESLLCGTSVVITKGSIIPSAALSLPGVYLYNAGDLNSLADTIRCALNAAKQSGRRDQIRQAAATVLNGRKLSAEIRRVMNMPSSQD